ncbi:MAG TPA: glycosyltransferase family 2 protein [Lachnospiraceae bacterium]|nr:glycosyltransferase family 2 protein [Lachnospiraceae bacterium]
MVSIIVPVYNVASFLEETIESVLGQTYTEWELLLVNDCSTDESAAIIENYVRKDPRIKLINLDVNQGAARARNLGLSKAQGRYVAFLDADDLWKKDKLRLELKFMDLTKAAFAFTGYEFADHTGKGTGKVVKVPFRIDYKHALKNTTIFTSTVLFDTSLIDKELIKMPEVKSEDTATWWNILRHGYIAYGLDENLSLYRRSENTLSSNKIEAIKRIWYLYREVEKLSFVKSIYNFLFYAIRAVLRRV